MYKELFQFKISAVSSFLSALLLGWGLPEMINGYAYAPYLILVGLIVIFLTIYSDEHVNKIVNKRKPLIYSISVLLVIGLFIGSFIFTSNQERLNELYPYYRGILMPDDNSTPEHVKHYITNDTIAVMLGDNIAVIQNKNQKNTLEYNGNTLLSVQVRNGVAILENSQVIDSGGNYIVKIKKNGFRINQHQPFFPTQEDEHHLIIKDAFGIEVLNVYYMNPKVIRVTGIFALSSDWSVLVDNDGIHTSDNLNITGNNTIIDITGGNALLNFKDR